jgi:hypothetical protein
LPVIMSGRLRNLIGWGLLALYAATTSLCHLAHDPVAHGAGCCAHGPGRSVRHAGEQTACSHAGHHHDHQHGEHGRGAHQHGTQEQNVDQTPSCPSDSPSHEGHTCAVCQYLADPSLTDSAVVTLAPTGVVSIPPVSDPLPVPRTVLRSYASRAPPTRLA